MGHNIEYRDYKENTDKKKIYEELNNYVEHATWQEGGSGIDHISWNDHVCESYEAAKDWIEKHDKGWYDCLAVKFERPIRGTYDTKKFDEKIRETCAVCTERSSVIYPKTRTSEFIGCDKCKSRLARTYLNRNYCPVCGNDLRPESMLKSITTATEKWKKAMMAKDEYVRKHSKKEIRWLVKIEYHT